MRNFNIDAKKTAILITAFLFSPATGVPAFAQTSKISQTEVRLEPAGDTGENDLFGGAVALSANGNTMVIGGQGANSAAVTDTGAAFIFERVQNKWVQTARLVASDARTQDDFGNNVAISEDGNTVVAAADLQSGLFRNSGAVYVFARVNGTWVQQAEIFSPTPANSAGFGAWGMGTSGNTIAVGDAGGPANGFTPVVDVFTRSNGAWQLSATIGVPDDFAFFPVSIAISGATLVVSNSDDAVSPGGSAYVFAFANGIWTRQATLAPADATFGANFGASLAIDGNRIAVGASNAPGASAFSGAVYAFVREEGVWKPEAKLVADDGVADNLFGFSISLNGNTIAVGAPGHTPPGGLASGAAYVYQSKDGKWTQIAELSASDGVAVGQFGSGVAVRNNTLLAGAPGQHPQIDNGQGYPGGEAYVYRLN